MNSYPKVLSCRRESSFATTVSARGLSGMPHARSLIASVLLSACTYHGANEARYAGNVPLRVTNAYGSALCELHISEAGAPDWGSNWIRGNDTLFDKGVIDPGAGKEFKVRPGKYQLSYVGCPAAASAMGGDGTVVAVQETGPAYRGQLVAFDVKDPVEVVLHPPGQQPTATMKNYTLVDAHGSATRTPGDAWKSGGGDCELECTQPPHGAEHEACMQRCETRARN
jgi:hypothetical protein